MDKKFVILLAVLVFVAGIYSYLVINDKPELDRSIICTEYDCQVNEDYSTPEIDWDFEKLVLNTMEEN